MPLGHIKRRVSNTRSRFELFSFLSTSSYYVLRLLLIQRQYYLYWPASSDSSYPVQDCRAGTLTNINRLSVYQFIELSLRRSKDAPAEDPSIHPASEHCPSRQSTFPKMLFIYFVCVGTSEMKEGTV